MIATSGFLTALEGTEFAFGCNSTLNPAGRAYSAPLDAQLVYGGPTFNGREGEGKG